jgi:hypothetical protein
MALAACVAGAVAGELPENRYDALGALLRPWLGVMGAGGTSAPRAVVATCEFAGATGVDPSWIGVRAEVALEYPDRVRVEVILPDGKETAAVAAVSGSGGAPGRFAFGRVGQVCWVAPRGIERVLSALGPLPPEDPGFRLPRFAPPLPEKQLAWLPALFEVEEMPGAVAGGRTLRVRPMAELAREGGLEAWAATVRVGGDGRPTGLTLGRPGFAAGVEVKELRFAARLPEGTWVVPEDAVALGAPRWKQLWDGAVARWGGVRGSAANPDRRGR